jgi:copper homeostasis protein (lipoprotein)
MKKLIIILLIISLLLIFVLPWWGAEEEPVIQRQDTVSTHNFEGVFDGVLPCADCAGIETTLQIFSDGQYELTENYSGKGIFISDGIWKQIPKTNKIILTNDNQFYEIMSNGNLLRLDTQGQKPTSQINMILEKQ